MEENRKESIRGINNRKGWTKKKNAVGAIMVWGTKAGVDKDGKGRGGVDRIRKETVRPRKKRNGWGSFFKRKKGRKTGVTFCTGP